MQAVAAEARSQGLREIGRSAAENRVAKLNGTLSPLQKVYRAVVDYGNALTTREGLAHVGKSLQNTAERKWHDCRDRKDDLVEKAQVKQAELILKAKDRLHQLQELYREVESGFNKSVDKVVQGANEQRIVLTNRQIVNPLDARETEVRAGLRELRASAGETLRGVSSGIGGWLVGIAGRLSESAISAGERAADNRLAAQRYRQEAAARIAARPVAPRPVAA